MLLWLVIFIPCVLGYLAVVAFRSLLARRVGFWWWAAFLATLATGFASGMWFAFCFEIRRPEFLSIGFPLPWGDFVRPSGHGEWSNHKSSYFWAVLDMLLFTSVSAYPVWSINTLWRSWLAKRDKRNTT